MASNKLCAAILVLSLLAYSTIKHAHGCKMPPASPCTPKPSPTPPTPATTEYCPKDTLKLSVCADVLGLVNVVVGTPLSAKCCALLDGLVDLEAALCLCTALKANVLGINLNVPVALTLVLSACQKTVPPGFQCP